MSSEENDEKGVILFSVEQKEKLKESLEVLCPPTTIHHPAVIDRIRFNPSVDTFEMNETEFLDIFSVIEAKRAWAVKENKLVEKENRQLCKKLETISAVLVAFNDVLAVMNELGMRKIAEQTIPMNTSPTNAASF